MQKRIIQILSVAFCLVFLFNTAAYALTASEVKDKIATVQQTDGFKVGQKTFKAGGCHNFVNAVSGKIFGCSIPSTASPYQLNSDTNWTCLGTSQNGKEIAELMKQAQPGDIYRAYDKYTSKHTAMVYYTDSNGVTVYQSTGAGIGTPTLSYDKYATFYGLSLYRCNKVDTDKSTDNNRVEVKGNDENSTFPVTIFNCWYTVEPKCAPGMRLDVSDGSSDSGANIQIWNNNSTDAQKFYFEGVGNGYYVIKTSSGKVLDVANGDDVSRTNVQQWNANGTDAQKWQLLDAGDGYFYIVPAVNTDLRLDVYDADTDNGTNVWIYSANNSAAQQWKLSSSVAPESGTIVDGDGESSHTHTKGKYLFYEAAHPHYNYYTCATCGEKFTDGSTKKMDGCTECYPVKIYWHTDNSRFKVSRNNATLAVKGTASKSVVGSVTEVGVYLYDAQENYLTGKSEHGSFSGNYDYFYVWYDVNKSMGYTLQPGTTYKYRFYAVVNGKKYSSQMFSFTAN